MMESQPQSTTSNEVFASTSQKVCSDAQGPSFLLGSGDVNPSGSSSAGKMCLDLKRFNFGSIITNQPKGKSCYYRKFVASLQNSSR